ncbi:hypothetical protein GCM10011375_39200 [Hymenobacter qilianensis]|uniref:Uncharacterized protein n=2 Tax=Hymenobacter qilianensis TaxID=1385715 RepID=A0ACB5PX40_9BACT|nr:hypothetical protein [Hymenobacter qilianensis]QNP54402.1 hypothetical protein H9L05_21735 [Hymenobacter qilianensis]GGF80267.1 hypothetical protein GCM10011375_39200 [Hymenobacter qilianensis]
MYTSTSRLRADLLVKSEDGTTQLIIEAKKSSRADIVGVAQVIREQVTATVSSSYFLFISTQKFWLWPPLAMEPTYEGDTATLLERYVDLTKVPLITLGGREFELLIYSWLSSIIFKPATTLLEMPGQQWLVTTGLHPLIYKGYIHLEAEVG